MVSGMSIAGIIAQLVLSVILPVVLIFVFKRKNLLSIKALGVGLLVFIIFSQILEKLLHLALLNPNEPALKWSANPYLYALYGMLAAGLFEEFGRYFGFKLLLKKHQSYGDGLSLGLGHGGIEAMLVGGIGAVNALVLSNMINAGQFDQIASQLDPEQAKIMKEQITSTSFWSYFISGLERVVSLIMQLFLSLLVLVGVRKGSFKYVWYAVGIHALFDAAPALYQSGILQNIWFVESIIFLLGLAAFIGIRKIRVSFE